MWCDFLIFSNSTYISSSLKNQNSRHQLGHSSVLLSYTYSSVEAQDTITSIANLPIEAMPLLRRYTHYIICLWLTGSWLLSHSRHQYRMCAVQSSIWLWTRYRLWLQPWLATGKNTVVYQHDLCASGVWLIPHSSECYTQSSLQVLVCSQQGILILRSYKCSEYLVAGADIDWKGV